MIYLIIFFLGVGLKKIDAY